MIENNKKKGVKFSRNIWYIVACLLLLAIGEILFQIENPFPILLILLVGGLTIIHVLPFKQWSAIDWSIGTITLFDIISCHYANCPIPAIRVSFYSLYAFITYWVGRRLFAWQSTCKLIHSGSISIMIVALLLAVISFFVFQKSVLEVGFEDTYHFRFLFRPLGYITNVWSEILLLILGWGCLLNKRYSIVFIFLCFISLLLSFSRGAYISSGIYLIGSLLTMNKTDKIKILFSAIIAIICIGICYPKEMQTTLQMNQTTSQQQSTESRIQSTEAAWQAFKQRPIWGYGNGNYRYALDPIIGQDSTKPFTSMPPNTISALLIEKGIVGILLYLLLGIVVVRCVWMNRKQRESRIIICTLLAFLAKDMSQSAWQETPFLMVITYLILAYLQKEEKEEIWCIQTSTSYIVTSIAGIVIFLWSIPKIIHAYDQTGNFLKQKDYLNAWRKHPEDKQLYYLFVSRILMQENPSKADSSLKELTIKYPQNSLFARSYAQRCYENGQKETAQHMMAKAINLTPRLLDDEWMKKWEKSDSLFYQKIIEEVIKLKPEKKASASAYARYGYILSWKGENATATIYLTKALEILPNLATPYLLLGEINKYKLLTYGAFHSGIERKKLPNYPPINEDFLWQQQAALKIQKWYDYEVVP